MSLQIEVKPVPLPNAGWSVGASIALELDVAFSYLWESAEVPLEELPEEVREILQRIPADWLEQAPEMTGSTRRWASLLSYLASLAGVFTESDYSKATMAIRSLTMSEALCRAEAMAAPMGIVPEAALPPAERLADLIVRMAVATIGDLGLDLIRREAMTKDVRREILHATRLLQGGDLHIPFWHWLDRGYYEFYRPWRDSQAAMMREQEERALLALGAMAGDSPPPLGWLPQKNAIFLVPEVTEGVREGRLQVHFWVQPFGLFDWWYLGEPGVVVLSFSEPGAFFEGFRREAEAVANRAKAIADPTRLMILRIIRYYGMDNTQIANYLGIARPTVSIHAKVLREAGLIDTTQSGRQARHAVRSAAVKQLFRDLIRFLDLPQEES